jgi:hypothetical protein
MLVLSINNELHGAIEITQDDFHLFDRLLPEGLGFLDRLVNATRSCQFIMAHTQFFRTLLTPRTTEQLTRNILLW